MGGKVTTAIFPPDRRVWTGRAVPPGSKFRGAITSIALLHDLMANTTVKGTAFVGHKDAIHTGLCSCTVHGNHPLSRGITVVRMHAKTYYLSSDLLCVNNILCYIYVFGPLPEFLTASICCCFASSRTVVLVYILLSRPIFHGTSRAF